MTARKTCHYYKKTKCGSTTDNNEPIVVLPDHCDPKINNTVQKFSYFMALKMSKLKRSYDLTLVKDFLIDGRRSTIGGLRLGG